MVDENDEVNPVQYRYGLVAATSRMLRLIAEEFGSAALAAVVENPDWGVMEDWPVCPSCGMPLVSDCDLTGGECIYEGCDMSEEAYD